jgi:hypothetical protein
MHSSFVSDKVQGFLCGNEVFQWCKMQQPGPNLLLNIQLTCGFIPRDSFQDNS